METKNAKVRRLVRAQRYKEALSICKDWRGGISPSDTDALRLGYECMLYPEFYKQLNRNPEEEISRCIKVLIKIYGE